MRESDLLYAAGDLCNAADNLRAIGLLSLAKEIDSFIATKLSIELHHVAGATGVTGAVGDLYKYDRR